MKEEVPCFTNPEKPPAVSTAITSLTGPHLKELRAWHVFDTQKCLHK